LVENFGRIRYGQVNTSVPALRKHRAEVHPSDGQSTRRCWLSDKTRPFWLKNNILRINMTNKSLSETDIAFLINFSEKVKKDSLRIKKECAMMRGILTTIKYDILNETTRNK
jgi:hypothetical protein